MRYLHASEYLLITKYKRVTLQWRSLADSTSVKGTFSAMGETSIRHQWATERNTASLARSSCQRHVTYF